MLHFKPNWYARILRNTEPEVHVTVVETPPVIAPPVVTAAEVIGAAQQLVTLNERVTETPPYVHELHERMNEMMRKQDDILLRLSEVQTTSAITAIAAVQEESAEEVAVEIAEEIASELPTIPIPAETVKVEVEAPKTRKRRWIG